MAGTFKRVINWEGTTTEVVLVMGEDHGLTGLGDVELSGVCQVVTRGWWACEAGGQCWREQAWTGVGGE